MKPLHICICFAVVLGLCTATIAEEVQTSGKAFIGDWRLLGAEKDFYYLHIKPDQTVHASGLNGAKLGTPHDGKWSWENNRLVVRSNSGWVSVLVQDDDWVFHLTYEPGRSQDRSPTSMSPAFKVITGGESEAEVATLFGHSYIRRF